MRHKLFWDVLSKKFRDAEDPKYVEAGLRVMRHIDVYLESGPEGARLATNVRNLSRQLDICGNAPTGALLREVVSMVDRPKCTLDSVIGLLCAYARMLDLSEDWTLGYDVWGVVIDAIETVGIPAGVPCGDTLTYATMSLARTTRRMGEYELSRRRYARAIELAKEHGQEKLLMTSVIDDIIVQSFMGRWEESIKLLTAEIEKADAADWSELKSRAIIGRGSVFHSMGRRDEALLDFVSGIQCDPNTLGAEIAVGNIAACAAECGYLEIARDANLYICNNASATTARMGSAINLIELAIWMNDRGDFDRATAIAESYTIDAHMEVYRRLYTLRGQVFFGIIQGGVNQLKELLAWARDHKLSLATKEIQRDLRRIRAGGPLVPKTPTPIDAPASLEALQRFWRQSGDL